MYPKVSAQDMLDHFAVLKGYVQRKERAEMVEALLQQVNLWDVRKRSSAPSPVACDNASVSRRRYSAIRG